MPEAMLGHVPLYANRQEARQQALCRAVPPNERTELAVGAVVGLEGVRGHGHLAAAGRSSEARKGDVEQRTFRKSSSQAILRCGTVWLPAWLQACRV